MQRSSKGDIAELSEGIQEILDRARRLSDGRVELTLSEAALRSRLGVTLEQLERIPLKDETHNGDIYSERPGGSVTWWM